MQGARRGGQCPDDARRATPDCHGGLRLAGRVQRAVAKGVRRSGIQRQFEPRRWTDKPRRRAHVLAPAGGTIEARAMVRVTRRAIPTAALLLACGVGVTHTQQVPLNVEDFRQKIRKILADGTTPSMAVAIARDGRMIWSEGFGFADREARVAATADTPYSVASVTRRTSLGPRANVLVTLWAELDRER